MTEQTLLTIIGAIVTAGGAFWAAVKVLIPKIIEAQLAERQTHARLAVDRQEHDQELEEVRLNGLLQTSVTTHSQLVHINEHMIKFITGQITEQMTDLRREVAALRSINQRGEAQSSIVAVELSRIVDSHGRMEQTMEQVKTLLMSLIKYQPIMIDPEESDKE